MRCFILASLLSVISSSVYAAPQNYTIVPNPPRSASSNDRSRAALQPARTMKGLIPSLSQYKGALSKAWASSLLLNCSPCDSNGGLIHLDY